MVYIATYVIACISNKVFTKYVANRNLVLVMSVKDFKVIMCKSIKHNASIIGNRRCNQGSQDQAKGLHLVFPGPLAHGLE